MIESIILKVNLKFPESAITKRKPEIRTNGLISTMLGQAVIVVNL